MDRGTLVIDNITEKEYLVLGKMVDGKYILLESNVDSQYYLEELTENNSSVITDTEIIFRYKHQVTEL